MMRNLSEMGARGTRFIVAGRVGKLGEYPQLADLPGYRALDAGTQALFSNLPDFRCDVSSTQLRAEAAARSAVQSCI